MVRSSRFLLVVSCVAGLLSKAQGDEALTQTQALLNNPTDRQQAISENPAAQQADAFVKKLTNGDAKATDEVYALAAQVFTNVVNAANGDVEKMKKAMEEFALHPEAFASQWTDDQKQKLKELSSKINLPVQKN